MRYNYKYGMAVDPRMLEHDFESEGLDAIPQILDMFKSIKTIEGFIEKEPYIRYLTNKIWYAINLGKGINLREREKILPVFKEYSRILKQYEKVPNEIYRGVKLPNSYKTLLTDSKEEDLKEILENLAYGLRSWTKDKDTASTWAWDFTRPDTDSVSFKYLNPDYVFDCDSYFSVMDNRLDYVPVPELPFDMEEVICYVKNPKIISIDKKERKKSSKAHFWEVVII